MGQLIWEQVAPGVWRTVVGQADPFTPLAVVGAEPRLEALRAMPAAAFPLDPAAIAVEVSTRRTVVVLPLQPEEHLYGLGLQFLKLNQRGRTRLLRVNSDPKEDTGETHAPLPFYVSSAGYGLLANSARIVTVHCGSCVRRGAELPDTLHDRTTDPAWQPTPPSANVEVVIPDAGVELYLFAGPALLDVVRRYNLYCGGGVLPPRWGLGFWHRVRIDDSAEQVLAEAHEFRQRGWPCDVIGLEPGWHSQSYPATFEWSPARFPHPAEFVSQLAAEGFRVNLWEHPYVHPTARVYPQLVPYAGSHTVWGGLVADLSLPQARAILQAQHRQEHLDAGVAGYKLDECDGSELTGHAWIYPAQATFPSGRDGEQMRQVYGLLWQKMTSDLFRACDRRTYGLVRASNAGASSLPYVLYSDLYDHRQFVRVLCNSSFSGLLWTPEVRGARTAEEWVRRMQVVCFSPLAMLNAWWERTRPWSFPHVAPIVLKYIALRMRLMPYLYAAFARYLADGTPPFRAMALEAGPGDQPALLDCDTQYLLGDALLVAPLFAGETWRDVHLPAGAWYEFETYERYEGGRTVRVAPGLERIPVFVRDGGIVPLMPPLAHAPQPGQAVPLEVRHYGQTPGRLALLDDDGETYAYERGQCRWRWLEAQRDAAGAWQGSISPVEEDWPSAYGPLTWRFIT